MDAILMATGLRKYYSDGEGTVKALDGVDIEIERGKLTVVTGASGSGKSTLLNILGGFDIPSEGSVKVSGTELSGLNREEATAFRRRQIGYISQNHNLIPGLTVWENIIFSISMDSQQPDQLFIAEVVHFLELERKLDSLPDSLSAGQRQRVAVARAVAGKPSIIFYD